MRILRDLTFNIIYLTLFNFNIYYLSLSVGWFYCEISILYKKFLKKDYNIPDVGSYEVYNGVKSSVKSP